MARVAGKGEGQSHRERRLLLAAVLLLSVALPASSRAGSASSCSREEELAEDQGQVLALLREDTAVDLTTLENEGDLAALAGLGYGFYPHQQVSVRGMGWPVLDTHNATPAAGRPSLLLYAPSGDNVTAPRDGFDFPYRLSGWAHLFEYAPGVRPSFLCLGEADWFVHERGIHTFDDGDFDPIRPADDEPRGKARGDDVPCTADPASKVFCTNRKPGDFGHPRAWDTHVWLDGDDVPTVSMTNPGPKVPGVDAQIGKAFFFPETNE